VRVAFAALVLVVLVAAPAQARSKPDRTPPSAPVVIGPRLTEDTSPLYRFSARDRRTPASRLRYLCSVDSPTLRTCARQLVIPLRLGNHVLRVRAVDRAGNRSALTKVAIRIVAPPPVEEPPPAEDYPLSLVPSGDGHIIVGGSSLRCRPACSAFYPRGTVVTVTAEPADGSYFAGWAGDCGGFATMCQVTMTASRSVTAAFGGRTFDVAVTSTGPGRVTSNPAGIDCPTVCSATFPYGAAVTLVATPDPGKTFTGWDGACASQTTNATCTLPLFGNANASATFMSFEPPPEAHPLNVSVTGSGHVTSSPGQINCPTVCSGGFTGIVTLTATEESGWTFISWDGAECTGATKPTCQVNMGGGPRSVSALFRINEYTLTVSATGTGRVTSQDGRIACAGTCSAMYGRGAFVVLHAVPGSNAQWGGACDLRDGNEICTVVMNQDETVPVDF
jgi:hypothetical protein